MKLALKVTPQHSQQYATMAGVLAGPELLASPLSKMIQHVQPITLAGQPYLLVTIDDAVMASPKLLGIFPRLAATSEVYEYFERIGEVQGPLLRPLDLPFTHFIPPAIAEVRRYKGKTNELFTHVLLNVALFAGAYGEQDQQRLRILDPLAGGGTTLFLALAYGYDAFGIEHERQIVEGTEGFIKQYLMNEHIPFKEIDERGRKAGRRYQFEVGKKDNTHLLVLARGDTRDAYEHMRDLPGGPHVHAVVADLPYGIQHVGEVTELLGQALSAWERLLLPGGAMALAWNATHIKRETMSEFVESSTHMQLCNEAPYDLFAHSVDRVIKRRDILIAVKPA
jgi:SAM-dependent methyltransferase